MARPDPARSFRRSAPEGWQNGSHMVFRSSRLSPPFSPNLRGFNHLLGILERK